GGGEGGGRQGGWNGAGGREMRGRRGVWGRGRGGTRGPGWGKPPAAERCARRHQALSYEEKIAVQLNSATRRNRCCKHATWRGPNGVAKLAPITPQADGKDRGRHCRPTARRPRPCRRHQPCW